jgi:ferredoxin
MAIIITDECINCGACEPECPNNAIYENAVGWTMAEGTGVSGSFTLKNGTEVDAYDEQPAISDDFYYIVPEKCTECIGFHDEPQCASVCPVECCPKDPDNEETEEELEAKQEALHEE